MKWTRVLEDYWTADDGIHIARVVRGAKFHNGQVCAKPLQLGLFEDPEPVPLKGMFGWSDDRESALRLAVRRFDPEAELPERTKVLP
jgi:hypothetical protein